MDGAATVIDADGHVEPALVVDWHRVIGGDRGRTIDDNAKRWFDAVGHGSSIRPGAWDPAARLADADSEGIDVVVLFGSSRGPLSLSGGDASLEPAICRAFNDWLADYCGTDRRRLHAAAWVPQRDIDAACAEAVRAVDTLDAAGVVLNPCVDDRPLDDPALFPLYATLQNLDAPLLVHGTGSVGDFLPRRYHTHMRRHAVAFPLSLQMASLELLCGGVLERFPHLRVGLLEGGAGWVPWWLDRLDEHVEFAPYAAPFITDRPSVLAGRYIEAGRLFWSCEPDEAHLDHAVSVLGEGAIVFASDYPHWDCTFPGAVDLIRHRDDLAAPAKERLLHANARVLYGSRLG